MAENTAYFDSITSARAMLLTDEEALEGNTTLSLETLDIGEEDTFQFIQQNFGLFLKAIRCLKSEDQERLLSYYLLSKTQTTLAKIHKTTQTQCSTMLRMSIKALGSYMMM
jgi:DNA-directed RNA polymerase specialized sigma subunit